MCKNKQCCPVSLVQSHVPGEHSVNHVAPPPSRICVVFFTPTAVLGRSKHILCCCIMDDDTNLLHLFRDITKQILTVSLDQHYTNIDWCRGRHWKIMPQSCSILVEGHRPEGITLNNWWHVFQCWSRLSVNICFVVSRNVSTAVKTTSWIAYRQPVYRQLVTARWSRLSWHCNKQA